MSEPRSDYQITGPPPRLPLRPVPGCAGRLLEKELTVGILSVACPTCMVRAGVPCSPAPDEVRWYGLHAARLWTLLTPRPD